MKWLRTLALIRYVRGNLAIRLSNVIAVRRAEFEPDYGEYECEPVTLSSVDEELTAAFIDALPAALQIDPQRIVLVFDSDRRAIYAGRAHEEDPCPSHAVLIQKRLEGFTRELETGAGRENDLRTELGAAGATPSDRAVRQASGTLNRSLIVDRHLPTRSAALRASR